MCGVETSFGAAAGLGWAGGGFERMGESAVVVVDVDAGCGDVVCVAWLGE